MNKYFNSFFSIPAALLLMSFFGISIAVATFIENDYGTIAARALIFNSWWLELSLCLLVIIFIYNIPKYRLYKMKKLPVLFLHLSFILIIVGAGITRYMGVEGMIRIREGSLNNLFVSSTTFLDFKVHDNTSQYTHSQEILCSSITNNYFSIPSSISQFFSGPIVMGNQEINIQYVDFIQDPIDAIVENQKDGHSILEIVVPAESGGMQSEFLIEKKSKKINNLVVGFNTSSSDTDFLITREDSVFYFSSLSDVEYMRMSDQSKGILVKQQQHMLSQKTLYTINGQNFVFKNHFNNSILNKVSSTMKNDQNKLDLLRVKLSVAENDTLIDLYGSQGFIAPKTYFEFNNLFFSFSYGSKNHSLPFAIFLKDFQLERYPGSNSPSSFASEIQVLDGDNTFDYRIFMNNVLNYQGYRFFQSSYDNDEMGTILSVNQDKAGTIVTYAGYSSLLLSIVSLFISRFSRFNLLSKNKKQSK